MDKSIFDEATVDEKFVENLIVDAPPNTPMELLYAGGADTNIQQRKS